MFSGLAPWLDNLHFTPSLPSFPGLSIMIGMLEAIKKTWTVVGINQIQAHMWDHIPIARCRKQFHIGGAERNILCDRGDLCCMYEY